MTIDIDVLFFNLIGPGWTLESTKAGIGGSELEITLIAHALARRGHKVVVANGVAEPTEQDGVCYVPSQTALDYRPRALWIERGSAPPSGLSTQRIVIRATDINCSHYDVHKPMLESGQAALAVNTQWQADGFTQASKKVIIPPALDYSLGAAAPEKVPGRFVYASAPMKGLGATIELWRTLKTRHAKTLKKAKLVLALPGFSDFYGDKPVDLTDADKAMGISYAAAPSLVEYRRLIASAEGLFMVSRMAETFCCAAAFAEKYRTRTHILCQNGVGGIREALVNSSLVTESSEQFERDFFLTWQAVDTPLRTPTLQVPDRSPDALAPVWEEVLGLKAGPTHEIVTINKQSIESGMRQEDLIANKTEIGVEFGTHLAALRSAISVGGSEFGLGLMLMSLVASTRATRVVEIGRFQGFSTLALAAGLSLIDKGWQEPLAARQRPEIDYSAFLSPRKRKVVSIDPSPTPEAIALLSKTSLTSYVEFVDKASDDVDPSQLGTIDVLFIDGDHALAGVRRDITRYVPHVRQGGYFILHDYFGWYQGTENGSPIKRAIDDDLVGFDQVLIDTGFASFVIFRKTKELEPKPARAPARKDGRPTVGLVLITIGAEASTVVARAVISAFKMVDAVTVVIDPAGGGEQTAEVCRHIGADVYLRPSPKYDYEKGIGAIAGARNEALAIAELKTDYVLMLDADDTLEGELPLTLDKDVYELTIYDGNTQYRRMQLWRSDRGFRYQGIIHEALIASGTCGRLDGIKYMRRFGGGHQDSVPASVKYARHARLVTKWLIDHPDDARSQFYLAQSLRDSGQPDAAIKEYEKRIAMTGGNSFEEERFFSAVQIARIERERGKDPTSWYLRAYELRPTRAEPLAELASWLRDEKIRRFDLAMMVAERATQIAMPVGDALFVNPHVYAYGALEELAVASYWAGDKAKARKCYEELRKRVPEHLKAHIENMLAMCIRETGPR